METKEVKHVDVWSAAKLCAAIYLVIAVIVGIISAVAVVFGMTATTAIPGTSALTALGGGIIAAVIAVIIFAVIGMILGFISGAISAFVYNLAAGVFGGLKVDLE